MSQRRSLTAGRFALWFVPYLAVLIGLPFLTRAEGSDLEYAVFLDVETIVRNLLIPVGVALLVVLAATTALGQWSAVLQEPRRTARWVRVVPIVLGLAIVAGTNYAGLADKDLAFVGVLLAGALCVGFGEEIMFRGLALAAMRDRGMTEARVALWSSVLFGAAHSMNIVIAGPKALVQVLVTTLAGYFFYAVRRWSGGILLPAVLHGLWDFGLFSGNITEGDVYAGAALFVLADVVLALILLTDVLLRRRRRVENRSVPSISAG